MQPQSRNERKPNRLIREKSLYLLQHAYNPVDWYPWSSEAFERAKAEDKPIFLSIGYSACHWCHVMEKECFEDEEVAALLNAAFVCIKVDREERPDLDAAYMAVCQAMGRSCGWPLNILMTPKMNPFFAASYIPKLSDRGLTGMMELIPQVTDIWRLRRSELEIVGADMKSRIQAMEKRTPENELGAETLQEAYEMLSREFDSENGGFGRAPKFPRAHSLMFLLRYWKRSGDKTALEMVEKTLAQMRRGGVYDQLGFGFHRYSTDAQWLVPHFEKMLYDQAWLTLAYTEAFQATGARRYGLAAKEIIEYVTRDLAAPEGGFFSAQDADTEGEEGKFYLWTMEEVLEALPPSDADLAVHVFGLKPEGNFIEYGKQSGTNILHFAENLEEIAPYKGLTLEELISRVHSIREALFVARKKRVSPALDDKVLTDWNGLIIAAMAKAGNALGEAEHVERAAKAADFLLTHMRKDGVLYHRFAKGEKAIEGFLEDYAFLAFGLIELHEATFEERYLQAASELTEAMISRFWDEKTGGFYLTGANPESTLPRMKQVYDGALPSGNSVALHNLLRLSRLNITQSYEEKAKELIKAFSNEVQGAPEAYAWLLAGVDFKVGPSYSVLLVGEPKETNMTEMTDALRKQFTPNMVFSVKATDKAGFGYPRIEGKATAYVCRDQMCLPPTNHTQKMLDQLSQKNQPVNTTS
jgi:uncharacterized protein YyaL (SSP411 family)